MAKKDPRIDVYIKKAQPFARPSLKHLRKLVHRGCPDVEETIKWNMPFFDRNGIVCFMAAFKEHCAFGFWKGELLFGKENEGAMGHFGRIESLKDLPSDKEIIGCVKKAVEFNKLGVRKERAPRRERKMVVPLDLKSALARNAKARKTFENFSYTNRREYVDWITGAKRDETRRRRLKTAITWLAQGKPQNWKYL
ncbi:MAG: YdeI/OmpD-associated family protein [Verrucomicrobia bacterium]|nr:YdeI/OmpD-associated family protein [Verrucomicrobiota bacterium]